MSNSTIVAGFIVSTVGFSIFLYGKKQRRLPQLVVGIFLLAAPMIIPKALPMSIAAAVSLILLRVAVVNQW